MKEIAKSLREVDSKFRALTSITQDEYNTIYSVFDDLMSSKILNYTLKGEKRVVKEYQERKNSSLQGTQSKLDFILLYLKENPNQSHHALLFEMAQSKVSEWVSYILPVLLDTFKMLGYTPKTGESFSIEDLENLDYLIIDVVEREVPRKVDYEAQKSEYSGKKKKHTLKNLVITDQNGLILFSSQEYKGKTHDKKMSEDVIMKIDECYLLADLGFQGITEDYPSALLPFKKPKNKELTAEQKGINTLISQLRVKIEHAFAGVKRVKIMRNKIRLKTDKVRQMVGMIAMAIHNLRCKSRHCT